MRVLLTGASGFLGHYIQKQLPDDLTTLGRSEANSIRCSLDTQIPDLPSFQLVVHNAGWAHRVPQTPDQEKRFYEVNLFGTQNLLEGITKSGSFPNTLVYISTVAVYGLESGEMISEKLQPAPKTPYAKSKYDAELLLQSWAEAHQVNLVILRLPLIAGTHHTPGNLGAMIKAIKKGYYLRIGNGNATKSIVLAEDVAQLIPQLMNASGIYNLTDGFNPTVAELEDYLGDFYGREIKTVPSWILKGATWVGDKIPGFPINSYRLAKLGESLTFDDSKARVELAWNPRSVIGNLELRHT